MRTAVATHAVTLTYGRDGQEGSTTYGDAEHERAVLLTYSDPQKLFKLLRRHGYRFRYLITGEYGSRKGRAHWHVLFFWQGEPPPGIELNKNWRFARFNKEGEPVGEFWPYGHTFWAPPAYETFRYNVKYVLKEMGQGASEAQARKAQSKDPPLGYEYFRQLAHRYALEGLVPQDGVYTFPEAVRRNGERVEFRLRGASARLFAEAFEAAWRRLYGEAPELSEWLLTQLTGYSEKTRDAQRIEDIEFRHRYADVSVRPKFDDLRWWMSLKRVTWNPAAQAWEAPGAPGSETLMRWVYIKRKGAYGWREVKSV